jgi:hypothetical protein
MAKNWKFQCFWGLDMDIPFKKMTAYFQELGIDDVGHTHKTYLAHAIGVYNDLKKWGCPEDVCRAGMFHSVYGTQRFQKVALPLERRGEIRDLIGSRGEQIAFWNCFMDRDAFDQTIFQEQGPHFFVDRVTGQRTELSEADFLDLMRVHLCDWLEQVPRSKEWNYRRPAYRQMAERLGGVALAAYDEVYRSEKSPAAQ